jgi:propanediol dehydratase small subunit
MFAINDIVLESQYNNTIKEKEARVATTAGQAPKKRRRKAVRPSPTAMFTITTVPKKDDAAVYIVGRPSRAHATRFLNIPVSQALKERLGTQVVGSIAMGSSALLEWALQELERQGISLEVTPKRQASPR